jgi:hypothetical protein
MVEPREINIILREDRFELAMTNLANSAAALGVDPDSLLKCSEHDEFMFDPDNHFEPTEHYQHHVRGDR